MTNYLRTGAGGRKPSPALWGNVLAEMNNDPGGRTNGLFEEWTNYLTTNDGWFGYNDVSCTFTQYAVNDPAEGECGILRLLQDGTDNDGVGITSGGNTAGFLRISETDQAAVYFEARVRTSVVADNGLGWFIGLAEEGLAVPDTLADNTLELADKDFVGFQVLAANGDSVNSVAQKESGTKIVVGADTHTMVADTWTKLGFVYNPQDPKRVKYFVDGVEQADYIDSGDDDGTTDATNFPGGEELAILIATKVGSATACTMDIDWVAAATVLP